jgi:uncharacterized protein YqeY
MSFVLVNTLKSDAKDAMRKGDRSKLMVIRQITSETESLAQTKKNKSSIDDDVVIEALKRGLAKRRNSIKSYETAGRYELVETSKFEIQIYEHYLPHELKEAELRSMISDIIDTVGRDYRSVIAKIIPMTKNRADGKFVASLVREMTEGLVTPTKGSDIFIDEVTNELPPLNDYKNTIDIPEL